MKRNMRYTFFLLSLLSLAACNGGNTRLSDAPDLDPITQAILKDTSSFYYVDFEGYDAANPTFPIGIFDSGTGGLTVMDALVRYDGNDNHSFAVGKDGTPDFTKEKFIYLADQANMPYGNYYSENKSDLLIEHVLKDAQFLLSDSYYPDASASHFLKGKEQVKVIVVACNTATAYAKEHIEALISKSGVAIPVIGVIDAGAKGALEVFRKDEGGSIGVFATVGTIASKGYENTILKLKEELGYTGNIQVYNQGGYGVAEAVDQEPGFIDYRAHEPREDYLGPSLDHPQHPIDRSLLATYRFDFADHKMLCDADGAGDCNVLQLNSPGNYVRYHLVSLMERMRKEKNVEPLKALVLGCTHYPYLMDDIRTTLDELYHHQQDGKYVYRHLMQKDIHVIDPAENVAAELHAYLKGNNLFNPRGSLDSSEFYISVPNLDNKQVKTDNAGRFTYAYKYGRNAGEIQEYVKVVPFSRKNIPAETIDRMGGTIAETFQLIRTFNNHNSKTVALQNEDRIQ